MARIREILRAYPSVRLEVSAAAPAQSKKLLETLVSLGVDASRLSIEKNPRATPTLRVLAK